MQDIKNDMTRFILVPSLVFFSLSTTSCLGNKEDDLVTGAAQIQKYLPLLKDKAVGMVVNHTSMVGPVHLVDTLIAHGVNIAAVFSPEHGFRGDAPDGEKVQNSVDPKTGTTLISLYGNNRKPTLEQMAGIDIMIFDLQDVGTRFYTYIGTMHYVMEACSESGIKLIILDRPNPNGDYVDGPILDLDFQSFVGMHKIPIVHGLTVGELARMINGEGWLDGQRKCDLEVIKVENYDHKTLYDPPVKPSPNLPNYQSVRWYPSLCLFEGTVMSIGRGTLNPFQKIGYPDSKFGAFQFTPHSIEGMSIHPKHQDRLCYGIDLSTAEPPKSVDLSLLLEFYLKSGLEEEFFSGSFNRLAGSDRLKEQILNGMTMDEIRDTWQDELGKYREARKEYLLYPDLY